MTIFGWLIPLFWLALIVFWVIAALGAKRNARPGRLWWRHGLPIRLALIIVAIFLIRAGAFERGFFYPSYPPAAPAPVVILLGAAGVVLCAAGIASAVWARIYLGRNWGMPMTLREGHALVTAGPYRWVRHPIYGGILAALLGSALALGAAWLLLLALFGIYFVYGAKIEEKAMLEQFPDEYPAYLKRTKMFVPFVL